MATALESAAARVCRVAGERVDANLTWIWCCRGQGTTGARCSALKGDGEPRHTLSSSDLVHAHDCSRFGSGRQMVRGSQDLCAVVGKGSGQIRTTCNVALNKRGDSVGRESFHVPQQGRSLLRCWVCGVGMGPMGKRLRLTRSSEIRQRPSVNERPPYLRC